MRKCKFDNKMKCDGITSCQNCAVFKNTGQQTFGTPQPKPVKTVKRKGHTTKYYKVKK